MTNQDKIRLASLGVALVLPFLTAYQHRQLGVQGERIRVADSTIAALKTSGKAIEIRYRTETVTRTQWRTKWDTVRTKVAVIPDTVMVPVEVVRAVVRVADSLEASCSMVIRTCEQRVANRDSIIAAQNQKIRAQARLIPDRWDRGKEWILRLGFFGLGVLTSK